MLVTSLYLRGAKMEAVGPVWSRSCLKESQSSSHVASLSRHWFIMTEKVLPLNQLILIRPKLCGWTIWELVWKCQPSQIPERKQKVDHLLWHLEHASWYVWGSSCFANLTEKIIQSKAKSNLPKSTSTFACLNSGSESRFRGKYVPWYRSASQVGWLMLNKHGLQTMSYYEVVFWDSMGQGQNLPFSSFSAALINSLTDEIIVK